MVLNKNKKNLALWSVHRFLCIYWLKNRIRHGIRKAGIIKTLKAIQNWFEK